MTKETSATGLVNIEEFEFDESVFNQHCVEWSIWAATIKACVDISIPQASVEILLAGVRIGGCVLNDEHQKCEIAGAVAGFKAEVVLELVDNCKLVASIEICAPIIGCRKWGHTLADWC